MKWNGRVYVNKRTKKIHKKDKPGEDCRAVLIRPGNRYTFNSVEEANEAGFEKLCERCFANEKGD